MVFGSLPRRLPEDQYREERGRSQFPRIWQGSGSRSQQLSGLLAGGVQRSGLPLVGEVVKRDWVSKVLNEARTLNLGLGGHSHMDRSCQSASER